jgi:rhodanese-related sulfurtransferase
MQQIKELLITEGASIIDVRSKGEFEMDHINGAKNIPVNELGIRLEEVKQLSKPIVVYCLSGGRSAMAVAVLQQAGFNEVYNGGGLADMKRVLFN